MFHLFSTTLGGWLAKNATYTSDLKDAWSCDEIEAMSICASHMDTREDKYGLIPVRQEDLKAVRAERESKI